MELRDRRLYRSTHRTFEEYCRDRFGHSRRQSYLLMDTAVVFDNLEQKSDQFDHFLPTAEGQVRSMTKLEPQQMQQVRDHITQLRENKNLEATAEATLLV